MTGSEGTSLSGIYGVQFYIRGKPWTISIDDKLLFDYSDQATNGLIKLPFARKAKDNALWAPILEKAWAKVKGDYSKIKDGFAVNGMRALTGAPVFNYLPHSNQNLNSNQIFDLIKDASLQNYPMAASTNGYNNDQIYNKCNLPVNHAYSMFAGFTMDDA